MLLAFGFLNLFFAQLNIPEDRSKAWCVDSTGTKKQINQSDCHENITFCP